MSVKQFEQFLVELFLADAANNIEPHSRYQFKSPDAENSARLFGALINSADGQIVTPNGIHLPYINKGNCKIVPILHKEDEDSNEKGFTENYISHLRDVVSTPSSYLNSCALVIIHNSLLDTIINSATDLGMENQVWSPNRINEALKGLVDQQDSARDVSECLLDDQFDSILEDEATMFGFEPLYKALLDGDLRFSELGMFNDPLIVEMSGNQKQIKKRLEENRNLHREVSFEVAHNAEQLHDRLKAFGEKFIDKHFTDDGWKDVDFEDYLQERKRNSKQQLNFIEEKTSQGATIIARNRAETKAGQKDRQIIIELDEDINQFELKLSFQGASNVDKSQFKIQPAKSSVTTKDLTTRNSFKGTSVNLNVTYHNEPLFFNLVLKRDVSAENHKFRCLVVRKGEFYLEPFKNIFQIENSKNKQRLTLSMEENKLKLSPESGSVYHLTDIKQTIDKEQYSEVDFEAMANEADEIEFSVKSGDNKLCFNVEGAVATDSLPLPLLLNKGRYFKLFNDDYYGEFFAKKGKVGIDNSEFVVPGLRLKLLRFEEEFLTTESVALIDDEPFPLEQLKAIDDDIHQSYQSLFEYLSSRRTTPSLVSWGDEYTELVEGLVENYLSYIEDIQTGHVLNPQQKLALKLGMVKRDGEEYYSSYHPLVLSYYLQLRQLIRQDNTDSFAGLPDVTIQRLSPKGLLPYSYHAEHGFAYTQQVPENDFWLKSVPQEKRSLAFVRKLVREKIDEFQTAFDKLFSGAEKSMIINAVNQESAEELFLGLVDYVKANVNNAVAIHVNLYDDNLSFNAFDRFAEASSYTDIKKWLELDEGKVRESADTIIDILRTRLTYSKFKNSETEGQAYAHLTFFRNNDKVDCADVIIENMESGIASDGLLTGEASSHTHGSYFTGFGLHNVEYDDIPHLKMAKYIGSLLQPSLKPNTPYTGSNALSLAVSENFKGLLQRSYDSSIWTTIIDPKVTLDFFHSNQDVVLIHYSDQYTSSSSYDAITVTAQRNLFEKVLKQDDGGNIDEFNAFNGDWLLKMMTAPQTIKKERKGVIGAYKFITSLVNESDITWVPLSVAEMIRVSGNIGLKMSDSEFSRNLNGYKKGAISDDVLFVGFKNQQMFLLPVEVKTGAIPNYNKAVEQAKELLRYLTEDLLGKDNLSSKLYRGLFVRQVLMQVDKYKLYDVFEPDYFKSLLSEKELWLQGNYSLARFSEYPDGMVVSHIESSSCVAPDYKLMDGILKIDLPKSLLEQLVSNPLQKLLKETDIARICAVPEKYKLKKDALIEPFDFDSSGNEPSVDEEHETNASNTEATHTEQQEHHQVTNVEPSQPQTVEKPTVMSQTSGNNLSVLFGHHATTMAPLYWEPTNTAKFMNTNTGIIGTMGTGKTQFTKSVITQLYQNQADNVNSAPIGMLIFDYKEDYVDEAFMSATGAKRLVLDRLPFNPLSLVGDKPKLPIHTASSFATTMAKAFGLGAKQQMKLKNFIIEAYEQKGIDRSDKSTWSIPAPTIADVWDIFIAQEKVEHDLLYVALDSLVSYEIFESDPLKVTSLFELLNGITVIELKGNDETVQDVVVALTLDLFYSQMQKKGKPEVQGDFRQVTKMILVDEADNFMSQNFPSLRKILKEGREYGVGVILSTQDITHFQTGENDYSSYVLTWVIHRVAKIKPQDIKAIFSVNEKAEQERLMETINKLEKHYSLYIDGAKHTVKMRDRAFWELFI